VEPQYLEEAFEQVKENYGSMYNYVVHGLGVSPLTILRLRERLLSNNPGA
jgi:protein-tyrosine phosphatase